ncbi:MAG: hypothetical protein FWF52_03625 [Candidatus Azobacteroides sp.]|nr:hypothetical protein [Candidatus Azobacteroides sp.]
MTLRILFISALIFTGVSHSLFAQREKEQSLSLSFHPFTMYTITKDHSSLMHDNLNTKGVAYEAIFGNYGYKAVGYDTYHYGAWEIAYKRVLTPQIQFNLGLICELSSKHWDLYDRLDGPRTKRIMDYRIFLLPGLDYFIYNRTKEKIRLSGQAGVNWIHRGLEYFDDSERNKQKFAGQFWCVFDRKISNSFWVDLGVGYSNLGILKIGVSFLF